MARDGDRLHEVLEKCDRTELLELSAVVHGLAEPKPEWEGKSNEDLRRLVERELRYQGSSNLAYLWRRTVRGAAAAGVPYEAIVDELLEASHFNDTVVNRIEEQLSDPLYAKELLLTMLLTLAHPDHAALDVSHSRGIAGILGAGLKLVKAGGAMPYKWIVGVAGGLARAAAGSGMSAAAGSALARSLGILLGPVATGLIVVDAARLAYSLQGPNLMRCALSVAAIGSLRLKYFPIPEARRQAVERLIESLGRECRECRQELKTPDELCLVCLVGLHKGCGTGMTRLDDGTNGRVCSDCRKKDLEGPGLLVPAAGTLSPAEWIEALGYRSHVLNNRLDRTAAKIEESLQSVVANVHQLRKDVAGDLHSLLRSAFGYLYAMFFTSVFLSLFGIAYFKTAGSSAPGSFNPAVIFRLSLLVMIVIPFSIWLTAALYRATRNARREDFERLPDGRRLGLKDYLFGFLYYDHPVENIWGPITLIGTTVLILMWVFLFR